MKLLIIRHGDPDYSVDSLTQKGRIEAKLLAERISKLEIRDFYVSPLGRARDTAAYTLEKMGRHATQCEWLREFPVKIERPDREGLSPVAWDWIPADWTADPRFYDRDRWGENEVFAKAGVKREYDRVTVELDALLAKYGYVREGDIYRVEAANNDTVVFFCHFGLEAVLLSHLINVSPMVLWQGTIAAPTSVTTVVTEERRKGQASFRITAFGDTSHLYVQGEPPAFAGRFCECYGNAGERIDD